MKTRNLFLLSFAAAALAAASPAWAYVGPGAGLSLLGALWALVAAVGSAILYIVLWPLRRWRKRRRSGQVPSIGQDAEHPASGEGGR